MTKNSAAMDNTTEIWKDIPGYEGLYQVSNLGRVKSLERTKNGINGCIKIQNEIILKTRNSRGYRRISLGSKASRKDYQVHQLVAKTFIPNAGDRTEINHKNGNKSDNSISNLEWCTRSENCLHMFSSLGITRKSISKCVAKVSIDGFLINAYNSIAEAAKENGLDSRRISDCMNGVLSSYAGFLWM